LIASNRTSRTAIAAAADNLASKAEDIGTGTGAFVSRTTEWGQQTAARMADRTTDVVGPVGDKTPTSPARPRRDGQFGASSRAAFAISIVSLPPAGVDRQIQSRRLELGYIDGECSHKPPAVTHSTVSDSPIARRISGSVSCLRGRSNDLRLASGKSQKLTRRRSWSALGGNADHVDALVCLSSRPMARRRNPKLPMMTVSRLLKS
jgi:hypothetical protein